MFKFIYIKSNLKFLCNLSDSMWKQKNESGNIVDYPLAGMKLGKFNFLYQIKTLF